MDPIKISTLEWNKIKNCFPEYDQSPFGGRPRLNVKSVFEGILYVTKNKIPWKSVPLGMGSGSALNDYYREWARLGVFHELARMKSTIDPLLIHLDWEKITSLRNSRNYCNETWRSHGNY